MKVIFRYIKRLKREATVFMQKFERLNLFARKIYMLGYKENISPCMHSYQPRIRIPSEVSSSS